MKKQINEKIEKYRSRLGEISIYIGENPELGHEEFKAQQILCTELESHGFIVHKGTANLPTAFDATMDSGKPGPTIGIMAEYDALPELGHACGHNLICTIGIGAAIGLSDVIKKTGGKVIVFGTPAEETKGGKVTMAEQGIFNNLDVALMAHPLCRFEKSGSSLAMDAIQFEFFGTAAHAAASPHEGVNALDAVIQTFNSINALRQQITPDARIHGIIPEGGKAANVIPDYAVGQFYVRAATREYVNQLVQKVKNCAEGAALQTGATVKISNYEFSYDNMITNETLSNTFTTSLVELGVHANEILERSEGTGSLDMGNVSHLVPAIHPYIKICDKPYANHTNGFREAALSQQGRDAMILGAKAIAFTAYEVLTNSDLLEQIKKEFQQQKVRTV